VVITPPNSHNEKVDNGEAEASLFEAISHDTRIKVLFLLRDHQLGFSELKHHLGVKSSGNLQHHLTKLGTLVCLNEEGLYALTSQGREAIMAIRAVRRTQKREKSDRVIIALVLVFSMYFSFMNVPFIFGTVSAQTPLLSLTTAVSVGLIMYLAWPWVYRRSQKNKS